MFMKTLELLINNVKKEAGPKVPITDVRKGSELELPLHCNCTVAVTKRSIRDLYTTILRFTQ